MKKIMFLLIVLFNTSVFTSSYIYANPNEDAIIGIWLTKKKDSKIEISKDATGVFVGKIAWVEKQFEQFLGLEVMKGMTFCTEEKVYRCPWIYSPKLKVVAKAVMKIVGNELHVKATKGIITSNQIFTRVAE